MLRVSQTQRPRIIEIIRNLTERITEATWPRSPPPTSCSTACSTPYARDAYAAWDTPARQDTRADHPGGCAALLCLGASPRPLVVSSGGRDTGLSWDLREGSH